MRYYGRDGAQIECPRITAPNFLGKLRLRARAVLFGRVSNNLVLWLGLVLALVTLALGLMGLNNLADDDPLTSSPVKQIFIRR